MTMATRIVVLNGGNIEQVGTPYELYNFPRNKFVATFIGSPKMNMLEARLRGSAAEIADFGKLQLAGAPRGEDSISVGVRPEQIAVGTEGDATAQGTITLVEYLGSGIFLYVRLASGQVVLVQAPGQAQHKIGEAVTLAISAGNAHYFDAEGQRLPLNDAA
jgi:ABC-type sugar transport system ATPase subunit